MGRLVFTIFILLVSGCSAYDRGRAVTLEQKRDILLNESPKYAPGYLTKDKVDIYTVRNTLLSNGGETKDFLKKLISKCYDSKVEYCAFEEYYNAYINNKRKKERDDLRKTKIPVKKGDLFYCKVSMHLSNGIVDTSYVRVGVKDNIDVVGFVFSNGYQIISPKLKVISSESGERAGMSPGGSLVVNASYDGSYYTIRLFDNHLYTEPDKDAVRHVLDFGSAGVIEAFDCKKA
ncbi:hypothetical protein ACREYP_04975 [Enterobacter sp. TMH.L2]